VSRYKYSVPRLTGTEPLLAVQDRAIDPVRNRMDPAQDKLYAGSLPMGQRVAASKELPSVDGRNVLLRGDPVTRGPVYSSLSDTRAGIFCRQSVGSCIDHRRVSQSADGIHGEELWAIPLLPYPKHPASAQSAWWRRY